MKIKTKIFLGIILSLSLIVFLLIKVDIHEVFNVLENFNIYILFLLLLLYFVSMTIRCIRWQLLINQQGSIPFSNVLKALLIGYMINNLIPAKVGELARVEYLKQKDGFNRSFILGTVIIERFIDLILVIIILLLSVMFSQTVKKIFISNQWIIYFILLFCFIVVYLMLQPSILFYLIKIMPAKLKEKYKTVISSLSSAIDFIKDIKLLAKISLMTFLIWSLTILSSFIILYGLNILLPFYAYFFIVAAGVLGFIIPSTSGSIGVYHAIATGVVMIFMVESEKALTYAIISHAYDFFPNILFGSVTFAVSVLKKSK